MAIIDIHAGRRRSPALAAVVAAGVLAIAGPAAGGNQPPTAPTLSVPYDGTVVARARPPFVIADATDPDGDPLTYELELATDDTFTTIERRVTGAPRLGAGHTILELAADLAEDSRHCWRVRARDGQVAGEARAACFVVSRVNDPPTAPRPIAPADGSALSASAVTLSWAGALDPEGGPLRYALELERAGGAGAMSIPVASEVYRPDLDAGERDVTYRWRVRTIDAAGAVSEPSPSRTFTILAPVPFVDPCEGCRVGGDGAGMLLVGLALLVLIGLGRRRRSALGALFVVGVALPRAASAAPPTAPVIVSPAAAEVVPVLAPVLVAERATDPEGDALVYDWELATDAAFVTIEQHGEGVAPSGAGFAGFGPIGALDEDSRHCWRVRADDGQAPGPWTVACFVVSAVNGPPTVPSLDNPSDNMGATTTTPTYSWTPARDPEGEALTYDVELADEAGVLLEAVTGVHGSITVLATELSNRSTYRWRARAVDRSGAASAFSPDASFTANAPVDDPEVVVCSGGCGASRGPGVGALVGLGLALGLGSGRRSRRR